MTATVEASVTALPSAATQTLPDYCYTDPLLFERERRLIFGQGWQYVGMESALAQPGDFFTAMAGNIPILVLRSSEGDPRAFVNVCRHRGSILVTEETGNRKSLQCSYHAWTYGLDGKLRAAPGSADEADFDPDELGLLPVRLERFGPFLFVNPSSDSADFWTVAGELPALIAGTGIDLTALRHQTRRTFEINANWKVVVDNYLECYHCAVAHPSFCDLIDVRDYTVTEYEYFSTQTAPRKSKRAEGTRSDLVEGGFYAYLWPNFTINIYPGPGNVSVNLFLPVTVDRTLAIFDYCSMPGVSSSDVDEFADFVDQVQREDTALCESVQKGLACDMLGQGRLMLSRERALRHFQSLVRQELADDFGPSGDGSA